MNLFDPGELWAEHGQDEFSDLLTSDELAIACASQDKDRLLGAPYAVEVCHPDGSGDTITLGTPQDFYGKQHGARPHKGAFDPCDQLLICPE
jgi:hypothetical protein